MSKIEDGGHAFPTHPDGNGHNGDGMYLRDWFAGQALNGMMANGYMPRPVRTLSTSTSDATHYDYAGKAYELADAMLKARQP